MKFQEGDFERLERAVIRGLGREPTSAEADYAHQLVQRAVGDVRQCIIAVSLALRGDASITFDADGEAIVHVRAEQIDRIVAELAVFAARMSMN